MNKILVIGSPGSGKSTLSKELSKILNIPILHLDYIFHIDNYHHINKDEFLLKIKQFVSENDRFIIDGNYRDTLDFRLKFADTIILFNIPTNICLENILKRIKSNEPRDDIAKGFDNSTYDQEFIDYVKTFKDKEYPIILEKLNNFTNIIIKIQSYKGKENFINELKIYKHKE